MIPLLEGTRVLELGTVVLGPYAGQILADLGADVVKVESIEGDIARAAHPRGAGMGALYANNNRNKRTISVDLKTAEGREIVMRLAAERDVLLHNMRADTAERLGLGFDALAERNPLFEAMASLLLNEHLSGATFSDDGRTGYDRVLSSNRRPYRTRDGWIAVLPYTGDQWRRFLSEVGRDDILAEPWFADRPSRQARLDFLYGVIATSLTERTTEEWMSAFTRLDIPASEINTLASLLTDPHLADVGFFDVGPDYPPDIVRMIPQPVQFHGIESRADSPPPAHGAHTRDLLRACGYDDAEVERLIALGVASDGRR